MPMHLELQQNFPNPFNPSTTIRFAVASFGPVRLEIFDVSGKRVQRLIDGNRAPGWYTFTWSASSLPSGIYFCRLSTAATAETRRLLLLK
ncbi:MAG TPA: T9SS type A sorting domain-containing protein [Bacteroidota bacterium]|nr:T9SS type A sorting domain-containing protein [Bacteroidota bacterium]